MIAHHCDGSLMTISRTLVRLTTALARYGIMFETAFWTLVSFLILLVFAVSDYQTAGSNAFARSGSIVVAIGVLASYRRIGKTTSKMFTTLECYISASRKRLEKLECAGPGFENKKIAIHKDLNLVDAAVTAMHSNRKKFRKNRALHEFTIIIVGTIVWGYGDLLI